MTLLASAPTNAQSKRRNAEAHLDDWGRRRFSSPARRMRTLAAPVVVACTLAGLQLGPVTSAAAGTALTNASFESGSTSTTSATCWKLGGVGSGTATLAASTTARSGARAAKLTIAALASNGSRSVLVS